MTLCPFADEILERDSSTSKQPFSSKLTFSPFVSAQGMFDFTGQDIRHQADPSVAGGARTVFRVFRICSSVCYLPTLGHRWPLAPIRSQNVRFHPRGDEQEKCAKKSPQKRKLTLAEVRQQLSEWLKVFPQQCL